LKELDVVLERYVSSHLLHSSGEERQLLSGLLELPDPVLADYLLGPVLPADPELGRLISTIRNPVSPAVPPSIQASPGVSPVSNYDENAGELPEL
jgi:succinate dehydrogenase flavin-adding protein (antitoxin of CptAB toxin-antitoxin module)